MALGSKLRRLGEMLTEQAREVYTLYGVDMQPKWFPVFYALSKGEQKSIMEIAQEIGQSHPSVSTIVKEMIKNGIAETISGSGDGRKNFVRLTNKGHAVNDRIQLQYVDMNKAIDKAFSETEYDLWKAIEEWEFLLGQKSLLERVKQERKVRERRDILIVDYQPAYKAAFKQLNEEWITTWFKMEEADYKSLDHPEEYIINKGGHLLFALDKGEAVGTCGLIRIDDESFELAKMAVSPKAKGKGIGELLGNAIIEKARQAGAKKLILESNTILKPAISLYHKLGFKKVAGVPSPYERSNIRMELNL
jgi:GNAT superfamily N-acetyltransferase/DNA-binding MarR family transcriptional regulator